MTLGVRRPLVSAGLVGLVMTGALMVRLFVLPPTPSIEAPDAIVVLSGGHGERLRTALELSAQHPAATLVISNGGRPGWPAANLLCAGTVPATACFRPNPQTTAGEARAVARLAREANWQQVAVVTSTYHATRASVLMRQCLTSDVVVVPSGYGHITTVERARAALREVVSTSAALTVSRAC